MRDQYQTVYHLKLKKKLQDVMVEEIKDGNKILDVGAYGRSLGEEIMIKFPSIIYKTMDIDKAQLMIIIPLKRYPSLLT